MNFLERYKKLGHDVRPFDLKKSIRVNTLKIKEVDLVKRLEAKGVELKKIPFTDYGYYVKSKFSLGSTSEYLQGYYYIQEAASMVPVQILNCDKKNVVLDGCAAPGGKTTQIAQYMVNEGKITSLDIKNQRLASLRNNLSRLGIRNTAVYNMDCVDVGKLGMMFDKVLLDAPCSGNLIADRGWLAKRDIVGIERNSMVQKNLLKAVVDVVKNGGEIVYSTCSLEIEEDEDVVQYVLDNLPVKLVKIEDTRYDQFKNKELSGTLKLWPDVTNTQGFFIAKFRKT